MMTKLFQVMLAFALMGYFFSSRPIILFLNSLTPLQGLFVYYFILFLTLQQFFGLVVGGVPMQSFSQTLGELLIIFAYFIIVDFESEWVAYVVGEQEGRKKDYPVVYTQAEDGAVYYFWKTYVVSDPEIVRYLTFVVTPAVMVAVGLLLTGDSKIQRSLLA